MKIVVTGALGHIGSRLIRSIPPELVQEIVLVDDLSTQRYASLFDLPPTITYRFFEEDVCTADLESRFQGADVVVHLAAITNAEKSLSIREQVEQVNFEGTKRVAQACARCGCKMIFPSTTSVYGVQEGVVDESCPDELLRPQSPYAESKLRAERMLQDMPDLQAVIFRFGTIFGTSVGMRFHTAINKFCWQASLGLPLTVWRTAMHQKRPYLDLKDAVAALNFVLEHNVFDGHIYNVLTTNATIGDIVEIISTVTPDLAVETVDSPIMNQLSYTVSNERFAALGFRTSGDLPQGIHETLALLQGVRSNQQQSGINSL